MSGHYKLLVFLFVFGGIHSANWSESECQIGVPLHETVERQIGVPLVTRMLASSERAWDACWLQASRHGMHVGFKRAGMGTNGAS